MNRPKDLNAPSRWNMRIWDDDKKEWLCQSDKDALTYYGFDITGGETTEFQGLPKWHPDRHLIWEQSTGLLDRNGKEIYEGDILHSKVGIDYVVSYSVDKGKYEMWSKDGYGGGIADVQYIKEFNIEVIGNIHEEKDD